MTRAPANERWPDRSSLLNTDPFFGREAELETLRAFALGGAGVLTLVGPGGIGKTRLSREVLSFATGALPGRATFCALDSALTADDVAARLAAAAGVVISAEAAPDDIVRGVARALASRGPALLILDNAEQAVGPIARAIALCQEVAPTLRCLATSREPLGLPGERVERLPPLELTTEAVSLFLHRGARVRPDWQPTPEDRRAIAEIVAHLDGLALAIELAASRMALLGASELRDRLLSGAAAACSPLLSDPRGPHPARHASMDAAMRWSWDLLSPSRRAVLSLCSLFRGGFSPRAVERVHAALGSPQDDPLDAVAELVERSLLVRHSLPDGGVRLSLYEPVRAFAEARLGESPDLADGARRAFVGWASEEARSLTAALTSASEADARSALKREVLNLLSAFRLVAIGEGEGEGCGPDPDAALRLAIALDPLVTGLGTLREHSERLERALNRAPERALQRAPERALQRPGNVPADPGLCREARLALGNTLRAQGRVSQAVDTLTAVAFDADGTEIEACAWHDLGIALHHLGRSPEAVSAFERALSAALASGDQRQAARARGSLAVLREEAGQLDLATDLYLTAIDALRHLGDRRALAICLTNLGDLHRERGAFELARQVFTEALELARGVGDRRIAAVLSGNLGGIAEELGRLPEALELRTEAVATLTALGDVRTAAIFRALLARVEERAGELERARQSLRDAAFQLALVGEKRHEALTRGALAALAAQTGREAEAASEAAAAERLAADLNELAVTEAIALHLARARLGLVGGRAAVQDGLRVQDGPRAAAERALEAVGPESRAGSDEVRLAWDALSRAVSPSGIAHRPRLDVLPGGAGFQVEGATSWVDLSRRLPLRRLLERLVTARLEAPGSALDMDALLAAGWPGERVLPEAGANRVYVALAALRTLGLRPYLRNEPAGWSLDPQAPVALSRFEPAGA